MLPGLILWLSLSYASPCWKNLIGVIGYRLLPPGRKLIKKRWIVKGKIRLVKLTADFSHCTFRISVNPKLS
jgi:hypothetical protein